MSMSTAPAETPAAETKPSPVDAGGMKKKNLIVIGVALAALWAAAIASESIVFVSIVGALTLAAAGVMLWGWRQVRRHRKLADLLQGAADSPEKRRQALAALAADPKANELTNVVARAQLLASDEPAAALALLEPIDIKSVPAAMQDDVALLKSQLLLSFGRAKQARPLVDRINVDSPQRQEVRPLMAAIVAETWARTGSPADANALLDTVDPTEAADDNVRAQLVVARVFARFAAGKKGAARTALKQLAAIDPNLLGRVVAPQFKVHPGLQRLAREEAERHPQLRQPGARRGRPR